MGSKYIFKGLFFSVPVILLAFGMVLVFSFSCSTAGTEISGEASVETDGSTGGEESEEQDGEETGGRAVDSFPVGFPSSVPVYPDASIVESTTEEVDGRPAYKVILHCTEDIGNISEWYKQELEKEWNVSSVSEGDMGDWSEFFAEAQNEDYSMTVYLYQEEGSSNLSIDLNVQYLSEDAEVAERAGEDTGQESSEVEGTEETDPGPGSTQIYSGELEDAKIVLVCASVGTNWNISEHFPGLNITSYDEYQFDKGYRIMELLDSEDPDIMIIKECAAYFPPESNGSTMAAYQDLIRDWVNLCRGQEVIPVLTTVVPIDPATNSGQEQLDSILEFNDWIKRYCGDEEISVLDLEGALRISNENRVLNPVYDSGDGLHPNDIAYTERLDPILIPALERAVEIGY
ncbi:MAG: hypothetical protein JW770_06430 [Actinobacteria bacterium]|nr:hypothetical protein [Actinomycetota bacterium]